MSKGKLNISLGATPSDAKIMVNDVEIEGVQKIEMIAERGKLTQVMLVLSPGFVTVNEPVWNIESETGKGIANAVAQALGIESFVQSIYDTILGYTKGAKQ